MGYGPAFSAVGTIVGCGYNERKQLYFTINGTPIQQTIPIQNIQFLIPMIGIGCGGNFEFNFGSTPFCFDLDNDIAHIKRWVRIYCSNSVHQSTQSTYFCCNPTHYN